MNDISGIVFCVLSGVIGAVLIIGTWKKWPFLTDTPTENGKSLPSSFSLIRKFAGKKGILFFNYLFGTLSLLASLFFFWKEICK
jgi:hypothetical protein